MVQPVSNAGRTGVFVDFYTQRAVQDFCCVEDVVNLFVFCNTVSVDAGTRYVEISANERCSFGNLISQFFFVVFGDFCDNSRVHTIQCATNLCIFHNHGFQWCVAGTFPNAQQRAVNRRSAIEPSGGSVYNSFVEVVVSMPFNEFAGELTEVVDTIDDTGNAARQCSTRIRNAIAHGVTETDFYGNLIFFHKVTQFLCKGNNEAVEIGSGNVFKVAAGTNTHVQSSFYHFQITVHCLFSCFM